jgi:hypothetical protein
MAVVQGIKEKVHLPIYDALEIEPGKQLRDAEKSSTLKFFVDVQSKTKLLTNLQSASLLPHYNTFEARAMRVVISDLPPRFPEEPTATTDADVMKPDPTADDPENESEVNVGTDGKPVDTGGNPVTASVTLGLDRIMELLKRARENAKDSSADIDLEDDKEVELDADGVTGDIDVEAIVADGGYASLTVDDLEGMIDDLPDKFQPLAAQVSPNNGAGSILSKLIYNTVTTFYVGEKVMIEMPTWFFPAGAGPYAESGKFSTHGEPNPTATFRFAEPIYIDKQQNFRVEIEIPDAEVLEELQKIYGPLFIWVVLDGYMTRGVQ